MMRCGGAEEKNWVLLANVSTFVRVNKSSLDSLPFCPQLNRGRLVQLVHYFCQGPRVCTVCLKIFFLSFI